MRKNLHISKKNLNFARCFSGKLPNRFSKILKIVYFVKLSLQKDYLKIDKMDKMDKMDRWNCQIAKLSRQKYNKQEI